MFARERAAWACTRARNEEARRFELSATLEALTPCDSHEQHAENRRLIRVSGLKLSDCSLDASWQYLLMRQRTTKTLLRRSFDENTCAGSFVVSTALWLTEHFVWGKCFFFNIYRPKSSKDAKDEGVEGGGRHRSGCGPAEEGHIVSADPEVWNPRGGSHCTVLPDLCCASVVNRCCVFLCFSSSPPRHIT